MATSVHVVPSGDGGWSVRKEGTTRASAIYSTQQQAIKSGTSMARTHQADLFVHKVDGRIHSARSYGKDVMHSKG
jgi:hypothetical protein